VDVVKPPKRVKVGPHDVRVVATRRAMDRLCREEGEDLLGHFSSQRLEILVDPAQAKSQERDTLLHELLHAIFDTSGLAHSWQNADEEDAIRRISPLLLDVLRSNPKLVEYLVAS
jgi:hypothetical protein